ncbi:hypothetical protein VNO78_25882 [Psophocarpus tetragonolobus]|uniref:Uncharacterized protein n=1 Tax=Psophocarpus tetragonolobus TaxID=3891 RepID=A0AAN9SB00_PSOTE
MRPSPLAHEKMQCLRPSKSCKKRCIGHTKKRWNVSSEGMMAFEALVLTTAHRVDTFMDMEELDEFLNMAQAKLIDPSKKHLDRIMSVGDERETLEIRHSEQKKKRGRQEVSNGREKKKLL